MASIAGVQRSFTSTCVLAVVQAFIPYLAGPRIGKTYTSLHCTENFGGVAQCFEKNVSTTTQCTVCQVTYSALVNGVGAALQCYSNSVRINIARTELIGAVYDGSSASCQVFEYGEAGYEQESTHTSQLLDLALGP